MITVECGSGVVAGRPRGRVAVEFRGIPFAEPAVGSQRFAAPAPVRPWTGVRDCVDFGPIAPQPAGLLETMAGLALPQSEDCLTLNISAPRPDGSRHPVLVWLHGGGFVTGTGALPWFDPAGFLSQGVVVVTVNYRLGLLGWADLTGTDVEAPTNRGLLDQIAALRWVRDNISAFGGDPERVTLAGESAGAMCVVALLAAPEASGLFHRAAMWSGSAHDTVDAETARDNAAFVLSELGVPASQLASLPVSRLLDAQGAIMARPERSLPFRPVVDGVIVPEHPLRAVAAGATRSIPLLVGSNLNEIGVLHFMPDEMGTALLDEYRRRFRLLFGDRADAAADVYKQSRPDLPSDDRDMAIASDQLHRIPSIRLAEAQHEAGGTAYLGLFTWGTPVLGGAPGACHALEFPFTFDAATTAPGVGRFVGDEPPAALGRGLNRAWAQFVRNGVPAVAQVEPWPAYDLARRSTMIFDDPIRLADDPCAAERQVWDGVL